MQLDGVVGSGGMASVPHWSARHFVHCVSAGEPSQKLLAQLVPVQRALVQKSAHPPIACVSTQEHWWHEVPVGSMQTPVAVSHVPPEMQSESLVQPTAIMPPAVPLPVLPPAPLPVAPVLVELPHAAIAITAAEAIATLKYVIILIRQAS
jgi:hypothetical protein